MSSARSARCSFLLAIIALITFSSASHLFSVADEPNCYSPNPIQFDCASAPTTSRVALHAHSRSIVHQSPVAAITTLAGIATRGRYHARA
jgi:hypothetical protein